MLIGFYEQLELIIKEMEENTNTSEYVVSYPDCKNTIRSVYCDMCKDLKKVQKNENTAFLSVPIIQNFLQTIKPHYRMSLQDVLSGRAEKKASHLMELENEIKESEINKRWHILAEEIKKSIYSLHLPYNDAEMENLVNVYPAIQDALLFLESNKKDILKVKAGKTGKGICKIFPCIFRYSSISDFARFMKESKIDSFITMAAIYTTFGDSEDKLYAYIRGMDSDIRIDNFSKHKNQSHDETRGMLDRHNCKIVFGIKNGDNVWLIDTTASGNSSNTLRDYSDFFEYGKRRTYLPIQVFFEIDCPQNHSYKNNDMAELSIKNTVYWLKDFIDSHQSIWLVTLFSEIKKWYFETTRPEEELTVFGDMCKTGVIKSLPSTKNMKEYIYLPTVYEKTFLYDINALALNDEDSSLIKALEITPEDFVESPLFTNKYGYEKEIEDAIQETAISILANITAKKLTSSFESLMKSNVMIYKKALKNRETEIIHLLKEKNDAIAKWTHIHENKKPIIRLDGEVVLQYGTPMTANVGTFEGRSGENDNSLHLFYPKTLVNKAPPIYISIVPQTKEAVSALLGIELDCLPLALRYYDLLAGKNNDTRESITNKDSFRVVVEKFKERREIKQMMDVFYVYLCFNKREFKTMVGYPGAKL